MLKKVLTGLLVAASAVSLFAGSIQFGWNPVVDPSIQSVKIYLTPGTNTVFAVGNTNATVTLVVPAASVTATVSNLSAGSWSAVATCITTNGLESANSNEVWTNVTPGTITGLNITATHTP